MNNNTEAIKNILVNIGEDVDREGLKATPDRVARMYEEVFSGYKEEDPGRILSSALFIEGIAEGQDRYDNAMVIVRDIEYYSYCEHHMVPFFGKVHIGYIPSYLGVGLSKLARLVEAYSRRLQIQERMTTQIADTIMKELSPLGCMVVVTGTHMCMRMRGVKSPCSDTVTSVVRGVFKDPAPRAEFLTLIGGAK